MKSTKPNWQEFFIPRLIKVCGYSAILFVALIFFFLLREGLPALGEVQALRPVQRALVPD